MLSFKLQRKSEGNGTNPLIGDRNVSLSILARPHLFVSRTQQCGWFALSQVLNTGLIIFGSAWFSFTIDTVPETLKFCNITLTKRSLPFPN